jgi:hypothetical protein
MEQEFLDFYARNLRAGLFTGFLTLSGFLFSVNTFIVVNMKKELYDHEGYRERVETQRSLNNKLTIYGPLKRLSRLLQIAVASALVASVMQFSVGLIAHWVAPAMCMGAAIAAVAILATTLFVIKTNLQNLFEFLEAEAARKDQTKCNRGR